MNFLGLNPNSVMGLAPYGLRWEDSIGDRPFQAKGAGYFGAIPDVYGDPMTELSASFDVNGQTISAPLIVPTLTQEELGLLAQNQDIPDSVYQKALDFALMRIKEGKNPFAQMNELRLGGLLGF